MRKPCCHRIIQIHQMECIILLRQEYNSANDGSATNNMDNIKVLDSKQFFSLFIDSFCGLRLVSA